MSENGEPAKLGFIEIIEAGDLTDAHHGRQVSVPLDSGERVYGVLGPTCVTLEGGMDLAIGRHMYRVEASTPVSVIVKTAAEVDAEGGAQ